MAHVILGLLLLRPMSLYDLIRAFEEGVSLFYSASSGSLKRALDGLLAQGKVEVQSVDTGGRGRKVYRVTDEGQAAFRSWMLAGAPGASTETAVLARLFFLGLVAEGERAAVLRRIEEWIQADLVRLEALQARVDRVEVPDDLAEVAVYQRATLAYGVASHRFAQEWFRDELAHE